MIEHIALALALNGTHSANGGTSASPAIVSLGAVKSLFTAASAAPGPVAPAKTVMRAPRAHHAIHIRHTEDVAKHTARHAAIRHAVKAHHDAVTNMHGMYDSTEPQHLPKDTPAAVYSTGPFYAKASQVRHHPRVLWIDTQGHNPSADVLDIEPQDATPAEAGEWAQKSSDAHHGRAVIIYTMRSQWGAVKADIARDAPGVHVKYWIADPNGTPHIVPGSSATQWSWQKHVDISATTPGFWK